MEGAPHQAAPHPGFCQPRFLHGKGVMVGAEAPSKAHSQLLKTRVSGNRGSKPSPSFSSSSLSQPSEMPRIRSVPAITSLLRRFSYFTHKQDFGFMVMSVHEWGPRMAGGARRRPVTPHGTCEDTGNRSPVLLRVTWLPGLPRCGTAGVLQVTRVGAGGARQHSDSHGRGLGSGHECRSLHPRARAWSRM